jgi:nicotinamidase/pyrazinamidase
MKHALVVVDVQNDFMPTGALPVPNGDLVVPVINGLITKFGRTWDVLYSADWHPAETKHFEKWPPHCVRGTPGAALHPDLIVAESRIYYKGFDKDEDDYSAAHAKRPAMQTGIEMIEHMRWASTKKVYVCGLALDYCVGETCLDFIELGGLEVNLIVDATKPVNVDPKHGQETMTLLAEKGVNFVLARDLLTRK